MTDAVRPLTDEQVLDEMRGLVRQLKELSVGMRNRGYSIVLLEKENDEDSGSFRSRPPNMIRLTRDTPPLELHASRSLKVAV